MRACKKEGKNTDLFNRPVEKIDQEYYKLESHQERRILYGIICNLKRKFEWEVQLNATNIDKCELKEKNMRHNSMYVCIADHPYSRIPVY